MRFRALLTLALACSASSAAAAVFIVPSDLQLVREADAAIIGRIVHTQPLLREDGSIETEVAVAVEEWLKGSGGGRLVIVEAGGIVGNRAMMRSGVPQYRANERALIFLDRDPRGRWTTWGMALGRFSEVRLGGETVLARFVEGEVPSLRDRNWRSVDDAPRVASEFVEFVRVHAADLRDGARSRRRESGNPRPIVDSHGRCCIADVSPEQIMADRFALDAHVPASAYVMPTFRWRRFDDGQSVSYISSGTQPGYDWQGAINRGMAAWNNDPSSNVQLIYAGGGSAPFAQDGVNAIVLNSATGVPAGAAGYAQIFADGQHTYKGETFWSISEGDVVVRNNLTFNQTVFDEVVTHELGHTIGFRHSNEREPSSNDAIMYATSSGRFGPNLQAWDRDALAHVYGSTTPVPSSGAKGDFNGDGRADLIWRNRVTGANNFWFLNGGAVVGGGSTNPVPDPSWTIGGTADFNRDGRSDIVWRNVANGTNTVWFMNGAAYASQAALPAQPDTNWRIVGAGDLNGDGNSDIVWRNVATGANAVWFMNGAALVSAADLPAVTDLNWQIAGAGDANGDGRADLFLWHRTAGSAVVWMMSGATRTSQVFIGTVSDVNWRVAAVGDFSGDGRADIIWKRTSGDTALWTLNNGAVTGGGYIGQVADTNWDVAGAR